MHQVCQKRVVDLIAIIKPEQAIRTRPDIGLIIARQQICSGRAVTELKQTCCRICNLAR